MEENQYLNEILYLIDKNYSEEKINKEDLNKIKQFSIDLINDTKDINIYREYIFAQNYTFHYLLSRQNEFVGEIPPEQYYKNRNLFLTWFENNIRINRKFEFPIILFKDFISKRLDIKIHLIQITDRIELSFEVVLENVTKYFLYINDIELKEIQYNELEPYLIKLENDLGIDLDCNLKKLSKLKFDKNTRNILIDFETNFQGVDVNDNKYIILEPAIINDNSSYQNRFSLMMYFIIKNVGIANLPNNRIYLDTFQLCPPCMKKE